MEASTSGQQQRQCVLLWAGSTTRAFSGFLEQPQLQQGWMLQHLRGLKLLRRKFPLPPEIAEIVQSKIEKARARPGPPVIPLPEPRPMSSQSRRTGVIAVKAGMTQEWDQNGVRVPLTVLWIDDCQVRAPWLAPQLAL